MNIDAIRNYSAGVMLKHKPKYGLENGAENKSADVCDKKNVNRGYYSGSFTGGKNGAAADAGAPFSISKSSFTQKAYRPKNSKTPMVGS